MATPLVQPARPGTLASAAGALPAPPTQTPLPAYAADPSKADLTTMAGKMQTATTYTPTDKSLVSNQLSTLLNSDSPYLTAARTRAAQLANGRGLLNTSMAAGAGELAAIESALPIAQQDAATWDTAQRFNTDAKNQFGRDANQFGREGALAKFRAVTDVGTQQRAQDMERWQTQVQAGLEGQRLAEQARTTNLDEAFRRQQLTQQGSQFNTEQANEFRRLELQHRQEMEKLGLSMKSQLPQQFASGIAASTYDKVQAVISDPEISAEAKPRVIQNLIGYANAMQSWGESFYGVNLPSFTTSAGTFGSATDPNRSTLTAGRTS